jgi:transcriptional regulator with XRE-family HTH domain
VRTPAYRVIVVTFAALLQAHLTTRNWTRSEFAKRVGLSAATISSILLERRKPWFERGKQWSDVLDLQGREREEFLDAMAIAASPSRVATILARLERRQRVQ